MQEHFEELESFRSRSWLKRMQEVAEREKALVKREKKEMIEEMDRVGILFLLFSVFSSICIVYYSDSTASCPRRRFYWSSVTVPAVSSETCEKRRNCSSRPSRNRR